jgi:hypothetical protein
MGSQTCPRCGLYSPEEAEHCDCGYRFAVHDAPCEVCGGRPTRYIRNAKRRPPDPKDTALDRAIGSLVLMRVGLPGIGMPSRWVAQNLCRDCAGWWRWTLRR